jgi:hypothetical protein
VNEPPIRRVERDRDAAGRPKNARPRDAFGRPLPYGSAPALPATEPEPDPATALDRGIAHFNAGEFFQAHEVWEEGWHPAPSGERDFWQGMIQIAVGLTHRQRGNQKGAVTLLERGARKLRAYPDGHNGFPTGYLASFAERVARSLREHGVNAPIEVPRIERTPA